MPRGKRKDVPPEDTSAPVEEEAGAPTLKSARMTGGDGVLISKELECRICMGILREPLVTECMHRFCKKCINQHLRQYDRQTHLCPLCNKEIKTSRSLKPDGKIERIIELMYPNRLEEEDLSTDRRSAASQAADASIWMQAATIHRRQVALMKEQQRSTLMDGGVYVPRSRKSADTLLSSASANNQSQQFARGSGPASRSSSPAEPDMDIAQHPHPQRVTAKQAQQFGFSQPLQPYETQQELYMQPEYAPAPVRVHMESAEEAAEREAAEEQAGAYEALVENINMQYDSIRLRDMLGIEAFRMSAAVRERVEAVSGPPVGIDTMVALAQERAHERKLNMMTSLPVEGEEQPMQLLCIPPIQVKFRRSLAAPKNLSRVQESDISFPADATVSQIKEALVLLIKQRAGGATEPVKEKRPPVARAKGGGTLNKGKSSVGSDSAASTPVPDGASLVLRVPVPLPSVPGSSLPFRGYDMHSLANDELTLYQVNAWYEDKCALVSAAPPGEQLFDLLFIYDVAAPAVA